MWSTEGFTNILVGDGPAGGLWLARTGFALACLIKIAIEFKREYVGYYEPTTYLYFRLRARHLKHRQRMPTAIHYRIFIVTRLAFSLALLLGVVPKISAAGLALCFAFEGFIHFKFHVNFFTLLACCFIFAPSLPPLWEPFMHLVEGDPQSAWQVIASAHGSRFCQSAVALTISALYIGGVFRKANSSFISGTVVVSVLRYTLAEESRRHHFDGWYPAPFRSWVSKVEPGDRMLRFVMSSVLALEAVLPVAVLTPGLWPYALAAGLIMHAAFTFLFPGTLTAFSIATVSTYFCFMP
ncbi:hypothetical protein [Streptomyces sp. NPDC051132]|uniref:hypothetical protein n=1 Tax=unclassified Streptomyces TaxID=2593676 RepID=UPI00341C329E